MPINTYDTRLRYVYMGTISADAYLCVRTAIVVPVYRFRERGCLFVACMYTRAYELAEVQ